MTFEVTILGCGSATPIINRHPSAQVVNYRERFFLIDCGEGTYLQMLTHRVKWSKIEHILISHLHGDHYLGLMGLIFTMNLNGRNDELHIYAQPELMDLIELQLKLSATVLRYPLIFHPLNYYTPQIIYFENDLEISTVILNHRIPCLGFIFREKIQYRSLNMDQVNKYNIPLSKLSKIKNGDDFITEKGDVVLNKKLTYPAKPLRSYAYCSDTLYNEEIIIYIKNVSLLYHEATFDESLKERAKQTFHSTAKQAGMIAKKANVGKLIIGHFSARYKDLNPLISESKAVFQNSFISVEGETYRIE
jgi:ribonuclease Z